MASDIRTAIESIQNRIGLACKRAERSVDEITLIAVSKTVDAAAAQGALDAGINDLGESKVQEARAKQEIILDPVRWHMIGHLQTNKARYCPGRFHLVHSIDRLDLLRELDKRGASANTVVNGLIQVNISGEQHKSGCSPDDLKVLVEAAARSEFVNISGLMTIPPRVEDPEESRPVYRALMQLRDNLQKRGVEGVSFDTISAGMTGDFEIAIEEGATMVRVGTAIFGSRSY